MAKIIMPQGDRKFIVYENQVPGQFLHLDFAPFGVTSGVIVHWQAKPVGYREWGLYDASFDSYTSCPHFEIAPGLNTIALELPDGWGYVPSAVIYYPNAVVVAEETQITLQPAISIPVPEPEFSI
jgi:hypothetical protein